MALIQFTCWNVVLPIWRIEVLYIAMWFWWIYGSLEAFVSRGVYFIKCMLAPMCDSPCSSFSFIIVNLIHSFWPCSTNNICLCTVVAGVRDLQSPPLNAFLSFLTSLSRPQGPRHFCCKQSGRAGPRVQLTARHHHSAKTCSMRCTKLQVNNTLHYILPFTGDNCILLMQLVFFERGWSENNRQPTSLCSSGVF